MVKFKFTFYLALSMVSIEKCTPADPPIDVTLYTRSTANGVKLTPTNDFYHAAFGNARPTKVTVNGWVGNRDPRFYNLTRAFLSRYDANVINLNWSQLTGGMNDTKGLDNFYVVGDYLFNVLTRHMDRGANANGFHLLGHGLGAHVCGYAGRRLFNARNVRLPRITCLDPTIATPTQVNRNDAQFVDAIHTTDVVGTYRPVGTCDFYANNGKAPQAGCGADDLTLWGCSHYAAVRYYEFSVVNATKYLATRCENYESYKDNLCNDEHRTVVGENVARNSSGTYYFSVYLRPREPLNNADFYRKGGKKHDG